MDIKTLFESRTKQLFWRAIDANHLTGVPAPRAIEPGQAYFGIRLCEMYLAEARKLWHQIYPMVHCYTQSGDTEEQAVISPAEFKALGDANLDLIVNVDVRLSGPTPYLGQDVSVQAGLYAVPGHDSAKALIDLVATFASFDPAAVNQGTSLGMLVKNGVESILGLDQATLHLGIRETFSEPSKPLWTGYYAGIAAAESSVNFAQLWVVNGRLHQGKDAASSMPYADHDYMLIAIERQDGRDDWQQISEVADYRKKFALVVGDGQYTLTEKMARLAALWPPFVQTLADSVHFTDIDRDRITALVSSDLLKKLKFQNELNPFLQKAA